MLEDSREKWFRGLNEKDREKEIERRRKNWADRLRCNMSRTYERDYSEYD
jgi:hypothetical protein